VAGVLARHRQVDLRQRGRALVADRGEAGDGVEQLDARGIDVAQVQAQLAAHQAAIGAPLDPVGRDLDLAEDPVRRGGIAVRAEGRSERHLHARHGIACPVRPQQRCGPLGVVGRLLVPLRPQAEQHLHALAVELAGLQVGRSQAKCLVQHGECLREAFGGGQRHHDGSAGARTAVDIAGRVGAAEQLRRDSRGLVDAVDRGEHPHPRGADVVAVRVTVRVSIDEGLTGLVEQLQRLVAVAGEHGDVRGVAEPLRTHDAVRLGADLVEPLPRSVHPGVVAAIGAPLGQLRQLLGGGGLRHDDVGHLRRGLRRRRGRPARRLGQRQAVHDRDQCERLLDPLALRGGPVALVEACRDGAGPGGQLGPQLPRRDLCITPAQRQRFIDGTEQRCCCGAEAHLGGRGGRRVQLREVPFQDLHTPRRVAGQHAEPQVSGVARQHGRTGPVRAIGPAVGPGGRDAVAHPQVGLHHRRQEAVRLIRAVQLTGQRAGPHLDRVVDPADPHQVLDDVVRFAAGAVRQRAAGSGLPQPELLVRGAPITHVPFEQLPVLVDGIEAVAVEPVPALHVVEGGAGLLQRDLREVREGTDDPLVRPQQRVRVPGRGLAAVEHRQAPGERGEGVGVLAGPHVGRDGAQPCHVPQLGIALRIHRADQLVVRDGLAPAALEPPDPVQPIPQLLDRAHAGAHLGAHAGPPRSSARSISPRKAESSSAASPARTGCPP
jgi:hypothetical protein